MRSAIFLAGAYIADALLQTTGKSLDTSKSVMFATVLMFFIFFVADAIEFSKKLEKG